MSDPRNLALIHALVSNRHTSEEALAVLQKFVDNSDDTEAILHDLCFAVLQLTQMVHQLGHVHPKIDRMLDTMVMHGPDAMDALITEAVTNDELMSDDYTRKVFNALTKGTDPQDRIWGITDIQGDHKAITLEGSGFPKRVFGLVGASDEQVTEFQARMVQYEAELK